jgi:uncharacterized membrane protein (UPF0127 family)
VGGDAMHRRLINNTKQTTLAERARVADNFLSRLRGLLFSPPLKNGEGLYITHCPSIHMFWMTYAIDAVFLDKQLNVVALVENIGPNKVSAYYKNAADCLELPVGTISGTGTQVGDLIAFENVQ